MSKTEPLLLSVGEVALHIRCSPKTVRRKIREGSLPAVRLGDTVRAPIRVDRDELDAWLYGLPVQLPAADEAAPQLPPPRPEGPE